jgi:hypothetical protein
VQPEESLQIGLCAPVARQRRGLKPSRMRASNQMAGQPWKAPGPAPRRYALKHRKPNQQRLGYLPGDCPDTRWRYIALHWKQGTGVIRVPYDATPEQIAEAADRYHEEEREGRGER